MALTLTGQSALNRALQRWLYGVSPGKTGDAAEIGGEMSHSICDMMAFIEAGGLRCKLCYYSLMGLDLAPFGQGDGVSTRDDQVIKQPDVDKCQSVFQVTSKRQVSLAGLGQP